MTKSEKAQAALWTGEAARNTAALLNAQRIKDTEPLTARTIRKARQYRTPALDRIAAALNLKDDPEQGSRS